MLGGKHDVEGGCVYLWPTIRRFLPCAFLERLLLHDRTQCHQRCDCGRGQVDRALGAKRLTGHRQPDQEIRQEKYAVARPVVDDLVAGTKDCAYQQGKCHVTKQMNRCGRPFPRSLAKAPAGRSREDAHRQQRGRDPPLFVHLVSASPEELATHEGEVVRETGKRHPIESDLVQDRFAKTQDVLKPGQKCHADRERRECQAAQARLRPKTTSASSPWPTSKVAPT